GDVPLAEYFRFVEASRDSTDYLVVHEIANQLASVRGNRIPPLGAVIVDTPGFRREGLGFFRAQLERLGTASLAGEVDTDGILRERVLLGLLPYDDALARRLAGHFADYDRLDPNLREPVAFAFGRLGGAEAQAELLARIGSARSEGDQLKLERGLAASTDPTVLRRSLDVLVTPKVNRAHVASVVGQMALNPAGRDPAWEWLTSRLAEIAPTYQGTSIIGEILERAFPFAALERDEATARAPFEARPIPEGERGLRKGLEWLRAFRRVRARERPAA
ncbi:MAG TPA: ERAP1-like C-terminal domain-containing protein, partial [Thermoplasmata archaeon]|nr:ERAP1-like C-terminal domain-containing protein [Thermoplasmata archaeon]